MHSAMAETSGSDRFGMSPVASAALRASCMRAGTGLASDRRPDAISASSAPWLLLMCDTSSYTSGVVTYDAPGAEPRPANGTPA